MITRIVIVVFLILTWSQIKEINGKIEGRKIKQKEMLYAQSPN